MPLVLGIIITATLLLLTTIANAQQQQPTNQTAAIENRTFQSTVDNFRVDVPEGWVIRDVDNTGFTLLTEVLQGYGILAQLCPQEERQQTPSDVVSVEAITCQEAEQEFIHIMRYPNLGARLGFTSDDIISDYNNTANTILSYEMQKLQEVGYKDIKIVNSTYTTVNVDISKAAAAMNDNDNDNALPPSAKAPAKLVEMTYRTDFAPNEIKRGYYLLTATNERLATWER